MCSKLSGMIRMVDARLSTLASEIALNNGNRPRRTSKRKGTCQRNSRSRFQADKQALGVLEVELFEHVPRQKDAIDHPEALGVVAAGGVEIFVVGFQESVIDSVGGAVRCRVGAEHDAILIFQEEPAGGIRLPSELGDAGVDVNVHVGVRVKPAGNLS